MIESEIQPAAPTTPVPAQAPSRDAAPGTAVTPEAAAPLSPVPPGGSRLTIEKQGDRTVFTTTEVSPQLMTLARRGQETAFGLMGLLAAIIILGPFARMIARRMERRPEVDASRANSELLHQQLAVLQQSVDSMSVEVERISESQRFQSKLLHEKKSG